MFLHKKAFLILTLAFISCSYSIGFTKNSDSLNTLEKKYNLIIEPKLGDIYKYKMMLNTTTESDNDADESYYENSEKTIYYYYTEEVFLIEKNIITYKITYDSVIVSNVLKTINSITFENFNSNVKDSNYNKEDYFQYIAVIGKEFFIKVSSKGEIQEVYGIENIFKSMLELFSNKLSSSETITVKESFTDAIKSVLQQQFQIFPDEKIGKDLKWKRIYDTEVLTFPAKNELNYKITEAFKENDDLLVEIKAALKSEITKKEVILDSLKYRLENFSGEGEGIIVFNATRSCTRRKETATNIEILMDISDSEDSMKTKQSTSTHMKVELLN